MDITIIPKLIFQHYFENENFNYITVNNGFEKIISLYFLMVKVLSTSLGEKV